MKTNLLINYKGYPFELACEHVLFENERIRVDEFLENEIQPMLFEKKHENLVSYFDFTHVNSCWIAVFDKEGKFVTMKPHSNSGTAISQYTIQEHYLMILPPSDYKFKKGLQFYVDEDKNEEERIAELRLTLENAIKDLGKAPVFDFSKYTDLYRELYAYYSADELADDFNMMLNTFTNKHNRIRRALIFDEFEKREINVDSITTYEKGVPSFSSTKEIMFSDEYGKKRIVIKEEELKRQLKRRVSNKIQFVSQRNLDVVYSTLIVNVKSIEKLYPGGYKAFFMSDDFFGITNGFLFIATEMMSPALQLNHIIKDILQPLGFKEKSDYVIGRAESSTYVSWHPKKDKQISWCEGVDWLGSSKPGSGNVVWHSIFETELRPANWMNCYFWFARHPLFRNLRLKALEGSKFKPDNETYDIVPSEEYYTLDDSSIPLLLGTQFGMYPNTTDFPEDYQGHIAILGKSLLTGIVGGLSIYYLESGQIGKKLLSFNRC